MDESSSGAPAPGPATGAAAAAVVVRQSSRYSQRGLAIAGAGTTIPLPFFSVREVRRQCLAAGWSFAGRR